LAFPSTLANYWTATLISDATRHVLVQFNGDAVVVVNQPASSYEVRCVLGLPHDPDSSLQAIDGVIEDASTGLMWLANPVEPTERWTWEEALEECRTTNVQDFDDWRLASVKELVAVVDPTRNPALPDAFSEWGAIRYWTSTAVRPPGVGGADKAVQFAVRSATRGRTKIDAANDPTAVAAAACVRDIEVPR